MSSITSPAKTFGIGINPTLAGKRKEIKDVCDTLKNEAVARGLPVPEAQRGGKGSGQ